MAARDTTGVCARAVVVPDAVLRVLDARETVFDAARDTVVVTGVALRAFTAERGVVVFVVVVWPAVARDVRPWGWDVLRAVVARSDTLTDDDARWPVCVPAVWRTVAFPSRTAASAAPIHIMQEHTKDRIFFISNRILAKLRKSGQAKYGTCNWFLIMILCLGNTRSFCDMFFYTREKQRNEKNAPGSIQ